MIRWWKERRARRHAELCRQVRRALAAVLAEGVEMPEPSGVARDD